MVPRNAINTPTTHTLALVKSRLRQASHSTGTVYVQRTAGITQAGRTTAAVYSPGASFILCMPTRTYQYTTE